MLIPKNNHPSIVTEFKPINLCNLCYMIISKILSNRFKPFLLELASLFQLAFIKGRNIQEASLISHEILHLMTKKEKGKHGLMMIKTDMAKAYDSLIAFPGSNPLKLWIP